MIFKIIIYLLLFHPAYATTFGQFVDAFEKEISLRSVDSRLHHELNHLIITADQRITHFDKMKFYIKQGAALCLLFYDTPHECDFISLPDQSNRKHASQCKKNIYLSIFSQNTLPLFFQKSITVEDFFFATNEITFEICEQLSNRVLQIGSLFDQPLSISSKVIIEFLESEKTSIKKIEILKNTHHRISERYSKPFADNLIPNLELLFNTKVQLLVNLLQVQDSQDALKVQTAVFAICTFCLTLLQDQEIFNVLTTSIATAMNHEQQNILLLHGLPYDSSAQGFHSLMIAPVQAICRYPLLLKALIAEIAIDVTPFVQQSLQNALAVVQTIISEMNAFKRSKSLTHVNFQTFPIFDHLKEELENEDILFQSQVHLINVLNSEDTRRNIIKRTVILCNSGFLIFRLPVGSEIFSMIGKISFTDIESIAKQDENVLTILWNELSTEQMINQRITVLIFESAFQRSEFFETVMKACEDYTYSLNRFRVDDLSDKQFLDQTTEKRVFVVVEFLKDDNESVRFSVKPNISYVEFIKELEEVIPKLKNYPKKLAWKDCTEIDLSLAWLRIDNTEDLQFGLLENLSFRKNVFTIKNQIDKF